MKKMLSALLACCFFAIQAFAGAPAIPPAAPITNAYGNVARSTLGNAQQRLVPVCNQGHVAGDNSTTTAGYQSSFRIVAFCPNGANSVSLLLTGFYVNSSTVETNLGTAVPINLGLEIVAAPWSATTAYAIGQVVSYYPVNGSQAQYRAVSANTNSPPAASNANWTGVAPTVAPVTCGGTRSCTLQTLTTPSGTTVTQALIQTDATPVSVPVGGYIAIDGWVGSTGVQLTNLGLGTRPLAGEFYEGAATETDRSLTGALLQKSVAPQYAVGAIMGVPKQDAPTVCYLGDSRGSGLVGRGIGPGSVTVAAGGTGYVAADIGAVVTINNSGASAYAVAASARYMITNVSGGAVTAVVTVDPGAYVNPAVNTGTLPSGNQTLVGATTGSGAAISPTFGGAFDLGAPTGGGGFIARGLDQLGFAWVGVSRSSDTLAGWVSQDYQRLQLIAASNCSTVIFALGVNDLAAGLTTMQTNAATILNQVAALPNVKAVLAATLPPYTTSTDGFKTLGNQTQTGGTATLISFNQWLRTVPAPLTGVLDTGNAVMSSTDSGYWGFDGVTNCLYTCEGLHMVPNGAIKATTAVVAGKAMFR